MDVADHPATERLRQPRDNLVLDSLEPASYDLLSTHLKRVDLHRGAVVATHSRPLRRMLFPTTAVLSFAERVGRRRVPVATVGNEGVVGHWLALDTEPIDSDIVCDVSGEAWSLGVAELVASMAKGPGIATSIAEVSHSFCLQLMQNVVCATLHHTLRQR
jgi:hypothetical protein